MAIFDKGKQEIISASENLDLSKASLNKDLSAVDFDADGKFFFSTIDRVLFANPVDTIKTVLDAHGFVPNLENILYCLDSFVFSINARVSVKQQDDGTTPKTVKEYLPCLRFELPQKGRIGSTLQSFYDEIAKYESKTSNIDANWQPEPEVKKSKTLKAELKELKETNQALLQQVSELTQQLSKEQKSLNKVSRALDSQQALPENTRICRVEHVDLKRRLVKVKSFRKIIDIPTHLLDRVPAFQTRCLITFDENDETPLGILFFDNQEIDSLDKRTAELLHVEGDMFKARDSLRNEFQIKALNPIEADTIKSLKRGMKILISIADSYVVRFAVLNEQTSDDFKSRIQEQLIVYEIGRNQLIDTDQAISDSKE
ncbi:MAG: hypothetical protein HWE27_16220 [Gammaproteobacteria bacterium]|nr:hypothetical protein [Gammaproteobacteria bacterium]